MASYSTAQLRTLLNSSGLQSSMPSLYDTLNIIINQLDSVSNNLITVQSLLNPGGAASLPPDVTNLQAVVQSTQVLLSWDAMGAGLFYEVRVGSDWDSADYVTTTPATNAPIPPLLVGTYTYLVKAVNPNGDVSANAASVSFTINPIGNLTITVAGIDNTVSFGWNVPTSQFSISFYTVKKDGTLIGLIHGTFFSYITQAGGTFTFTVQATDIAGNESSLTTGSTVTVVIQDPGDFVLVESLHDDFSGTFTDAILDENDAVLAPVNTSDSWDDHFSNNSWSDIQDQIDAGYPIYIQPNVDSGSYQTIFDFGDTFSSVLIDIIYTSNLIAGTVALSWLLEYSTNETDWTTAGTSQSLFLTDTFQYLRVTITFTPTDDKGLIEITSLLCNLSIRTFLDSGNVDIYAADSGGTVVTYNKTFNEMISVTATPVIVQPMYLIINSFDATSFLISAYDTTGNRIDTTVHWKAHGII